MMYLGKWPVVSDRDFVTVAFTEKFGDDKMVIGVTDASDLYEYPVVKGKVRGEVLAGGYVLEKIDDKKTRVYYVSFSDLKGMIPQMLINMAQKNQAGIPGRVQSKMDKEGK